jgi:ribosomal protein S18 acetylase RimI-like enzyme
VKTQSYRFRGGVARVAAWHGRADIASVALQCRGAISTATVAELLEHLRASGYTEVITNALAPGASLPLVDSGFAIRGRLHLLAHDLVSLPPATRRTRRARSADREALLCVDRAAFDDFWQLDDIGFDQAVRATPRSHTLVTKESPPAGYALLGRADDVGYVQRLAIRPDAQGRGLGPALLGDGLRWLRARGARSAYVNTQVENARALELYERAGFRRMPVGLCVLGRSL